MGISPHHNAIHTIYIVKS